MKQLYRQQINTVRSQVINIDNGAGTTLDEALFRVGSKGGRLVRVYAIYNEAAGLRARISNLALPQAGRNMSPQPLTLTARQSVM